MHQGWTQGESILCLETLRRTSESSSAPRQSPTSLLCTVTIQDGIRVEFQDCANFKFTVKSRRRMAEGYGHHHPGHHHDLQMSHRNPEAYNPHPHPTGELVSVFTEANPNYRLAVKPEGVLLAFKNRHDPQQQWIKVDMADKFIDSEGCPGFVLLNKATGMALRHGTEEGDAVTAELFRPNSVDQTILWSQGKDEGKGYSAIRVVTNIGLNLDAQRGDRKHGGIKDGHRMIVFSWTKGENQKWKLEPVDVEPDHSSHGAY